MQFDDAPNAGDSTPENRMAIAGLIASNIGFVVLFVGGIVGIIFGVIGLMNARDPRVRGRGMAIAAIVVGAVSVGTSAAVWYSLWARTRGR